MKNKKLVLVEPSEVSIGVEGAKRSQEPFGLCIIGGYIKDKGIDTSIVCPTSQNPTVSIDNILEQNPTHVGFGAFLCNLPESLKLAEQIKTRNKKIITILGGNGSNIDAATISNNPFIDYVVKGEGVYPLYDLLTASPNHRGIIYQNGRMVANNPSRTDLNDITLPLRTKEMMRGRVRGDLTNPAQYDQHYATTFTTTGCSNHCKFCQTQEMFPGGIFFRNPKKVVGEIKQCQDNFGSNYFLLTDPILFGGTEGLKTGHAQKCAELLSQTGAKFYALARLDMPDEYWYLMQQAGITKVGVGIESIVLKEIKDGTPDMYLEKIERYAENAIKRGIFCKGLFMVGYQDQTLEQIDQEIEQIENLKWLSDIRISWLTPFEKSEKERASLFKENLIYTSNISYWDTNHPVYKIDGLRLMEAQQIRKKMYHAFYTSAHTDQTAKRLIQINPYLRKSYEWFNANVLANSGLKINLD